MIYDDLSKLIGKTIKEGRLKKGLTLEELAKAVGVTKATVQKYETGQIKRIGPDKLKQLDDILDIRLLRFSPEYYGGFTGWAERCIKVDKLHELIVELYGKDADDLLSRAVRLTVEGQRKLIDRADELLEVRKYVLAAALYDANTAKESEWE